MLHWFPFLDKTRWKKEGAWLCAPTSDEEPLTLALSLEGGEGVYEEAL